MKKGAMQKTVFAVSGLILIALGGAWAINNKAPMEIKPVEILYSEKFENFPPGASATINLLADEKAYSYEVAMSDTENVINNMNVKNLSAMNDIYVLHSTAKISDTDYIDIELQIDKKSNNVSVALTDFPLASQAHISIDGNSYSNTVPVDWAGQLKLQVQPDNKLAGSNICLVMKGINNSEPASLCHHIASGEDSQARGGRT